MGRHEKKIEKVQRKFLEWEKRTHTLIFVSAFTGFPPFYAATVVAGMLRLSFAWFTIVGTAGRTLRFLAIVYFPQLVMRFV